MGPFGNLFGKNDKAPEWASFFSAAEYQRFEKLVCDYFHEEGAEVAVEEGFVHVPERDHTYGLQNLAQVCHMSPEEEWRDTIGEHFLRLREAEDDRDRIEQEMEDFDAVADLLAVRLYHEDYVNSLGRDKVVFREDFEGTVSVLVVDLPTTIQTVPSETAKKWDKSVDELFAHGLGNVRRTVVPEVSTEEITPDVVIRYFVSDNFLTSTHALMLNQHPDCIGTYGALVGIPHRHVVLCFPINDIGVVSAINAMLPVIQGMFEEGPGSISPHLYWYQDDQFTLLPCEVTEEEMRFQPPAEFIAVLNELAGD